MTFYLALIPYTRSCIDCISYFSLFHFREKKGPKYIFNPKSDEKSKQSYFYSTYLTTRFRAKNHCKMAELIEQVRKKFLFFNTLKLSNSWERALRIRINLCRLKSTVRMLSERLKTHLYLERIKSGFRLSWSSIKSALSIGRKLRTKRYKQIRLRTL